MTWQTKSLIVTLLFLVALGAFDIWVIWSYGMEVSISRAILALNERWPFLSFLVIFAFGLLAGHFFWPQPRGR